MRDIASECLDTVYMDINSMYNTAHEAAKQDPTRENLTHADTMQMVLDYLEGRLYEMDCQLENQVESTHGKVR